MCIERRKVPVFFTLKNRSSVPNFEGFLRPKNCVTTAPTAATSVLCNIGLPISPTKLGIWEYHYYLRHWHLGRSAVWLHKALIDQKRWLIWSIYKYFFGWSLKHFYANMITIPFAIGRIVGFKVHDQKQINGPCWTANPDLGVNCSDW